MWIRHPADPSLKVHKPLAVSFNIDDAEPLDEALLECWESFAKEDREWWC